MILWWIGCGPCWINLCLPPCGFVFWCLLLRRSHVEDLQGSVLAWVMGFVGVMLEVIQWFRSLHWIFTCNQLYRQLDDSLWFEGQHCSKKLDDGFLFVACCEKADWNLKIGTLPWMFLWYTFWDLQRCKPLQCNKRICNGELLEFRGCLLGLQWWMTCWLGAWHRRILAECWHL